MKVWLPVLFCLLLGLTVRSQSPNGLENGDFLFARLACGPLCEAIEAVTRLPDGRSFSHVGLVIRRGDSVLILEAIGSRVQVRPYAAFRAASPFPLVRAQLPDSLKSCLPGAIAFGLKQVGKPYDEAFLPDNGAYYCSELLSDCFRLGCGRNLFPLQPMTYKMPGSPRFFPAWIDYFQKRHQPVPEGIPGCNPSGILASGVLIERPFP